jgi:hypothetical protein
LDAFDGGAVMDENDLVLRFKSRRALRLLGEAPEIAVAAVKQIRPSGGQGVRVDGGDKAQLPLNAGALDDANEIYKRLAKWVLGHAHTLGVPLPPTLLGFARLEQEPTGFPSWAREDDVYQLMLAVSEWLRAYDWAIWQLTVAPIYWDDVKTIVEPLRLRYRPEVKVDVFASRDCPVCGRRRTVIVNLDEESEAVVASCTFCGFVVPHEFTQKYLEKEKAA